MQPRDNQHRHWIRGHTLAQRTVLVVLVAGAFSLTGVVLRIACVGRSCEEPTTAAADVPFCRLPDPTRSAVAAGFRDGRSPNVLAVGKVSIAGGSAWGDGAAVPWPGANEVGALPLVLSGTGFAIDADIPDGITLDRIAPTVAQAMGIERPHPEVRSGTALDGLTTGERPDIVVMIVMKGVGSSEASQMGSVAALADRGSATSSATSGSSPLDPAALMTTIGTGGLPRQHGITGTLVRNDSGKLVVAWGPRAPVSVIAGLGDDLDELTDQRAEIALIAVDEADRGLIGSDWYIEHDRDVVLITPSAEAADAVAQILRRHTNDDVPDLLGVTLQGDPDVIDEAVTEIVSSVEASTTHPAFVVTATGSYERSAAISAAEIESIVESRVAGSVIEASAPGGFFVDQQVLAEEGIPEDEIIAALTDIERNGTKVFADVFPAIAVSFERYC